MTDLLPIFATPLLSSEFDAFLINPLLYPFCKFVLAASLFYSWTLGSLQSLTTFNIYFCLYVCLTEKKSTCFVIFKLPPEATQRRFVCLSVWKKKDFFPSFFNNRELPPKASQVVAEGDGLQVTQYKDNKNYLRTTFLVIGAGNF